MSNVIVRSLLSLVLVASLEIIVAHASSWKPLVRIATLDDLYIGPLVYNGSLYGPYGRGAKADATYWEISQWLNPFPFLGGPTVVVPPNALCNGAGIKGIWSIENPSMRLCVSSSTNSSALWKAGEKIVQLAQDGKDLQCGNEFDLFLSPIDAVYPSYNQNVDLQPLSQIQDLRLNVSFELVFTATSQRCEKTPEQCGPSGQVDYSYITIGIPLSNNFTDQTIFYQINVFDTRWSFCPGINPCEPSGPSWYFTTLPQLGVNYNIADFFNQHCLRQSGDMSRVSLGDQLLSTLKESVAYASHTFGADGNLSHWFVGSLYIGSGMQGSAIITTNVGSISFDALII